MPISLHLSHVTLAAALDTIESKTSYTFIYDASKVNVNQVVSIDTESHQLMDILNLLLKETNIIYTVVGQQVILSRAEAILLLRQEKKQLTGVVVDSNDLPIIGANIWEKESNNGTVTNLDGEFSLTVSPQSPITVSYIGYQSKEVDHTGKYQIRIELIENSLALDEVVVTALGIEKRESTLPYSTQQIHADDITKVKNLNMINSLIGRTAGIQINQSSSGLGGSSKVIIRGNRSVSGNNQPLYVIDGVPMINTSTEQPFSILGGTADAGNRDGGDGISNLNPEDIESMTILKGAASTALYGSKAANGVILITTRRGTPGERKITFSSNLTAETATKLPLFQNNYGRASGTSHSWGEKEILPQHNNLESYFNRGLTAIHALTFSTGNDRAQTYVSYANTAAKGITDNNTLDKNNLNLHELLNFFDDRLTLEVNANILVQKIKNKP
ncbi:TonB-dependent receptor plug domain-containing protein, partial [Parabacteroides sp. OttesenSCG-928-N08]|nr:TonB-dependent receptor plug domain-containing protein [Parabacteroides sp. OttesenSCG-928-N08]